jgi:argonaute-like protein implicated in RNA metabolism and viral defense
MKNIILLISLELNNENLAEDWKKMSDGISDSLKNIDGFIYRDSASGEDGKIYCIVKWESAEKQAAFNKILESDAFKNEMIEFAKIVNMETMKSEVLTVI